MLLGSFVSKTFQKNLFAEVSVAVVGIHFFLYFWFSFNLRSESLNVQPFGDLVLYKAQKMPQALIISSRFSYCGRGGMTHYVSLLFAKNQDCIWK